LQTSTVLLASAERGRGTKVQEARQRVAGSPNGTPLSFSLSAHHSGGFHRDSAKYREFWAKLNRGKHSAADYKRIGKGGKEIWILASYNPVLDERKKPFKVVKFATDVTDQKLGTGNYAGQIAAIGRSQAVIEFNMDGTIIGANSNFLGALGYALAELQGKHHSMFVEQAARPSNWH
jgi:methyl-accepting chemotaxis protein